MHAIELPQAWQGFIDLLVLELLTSCGDQVLHHDLINVTSIMSCPSGLTILLVLSHILLPPLHSSHYNMYAELLHVPILDALGNALDSPALL